MSQADTAKLLSYLDAIDLVVSDPCNLLRPMREEANGAFVMDAATTDKMHCARRQIERRIVDAARQALPKIVEKNPALAPHAELLRAVFNTSPVLLTNLDEVASFEDGGEIFAPASPLWFQMAVARKLLADDAAGAVKLLAPTAKRQEAALAVG